MCEIKIDDLWKYIGYTVRVHPDTIMDIPEGQYVVLGKESFGVTLGNYTNRSTYLIEDYLDNASVTLVNGVPDLKTLLDFKLAGLISLANEGWTENKDNFLNITPYLNEYKILKGLV